MKRYLQALIAADLKTKMVILGGPRQVGKTTLSLQLLDKSDENHPAYLNWDFPENKKQLQAGILPANQKLIILDEIHKYKDWRNLIKGLYDKNKKTIQFLITGSARLDFYRRGGDSLMGRYHFYRLHPLSLYEISKNCQQNDLEKLLKFGGFPEMYLAANERELKKWQRVRVSRVIKDDLLSLEQVKEVSQIELLASLLIDRVGSLLSLNSLREDLHCSHEAVSRWVSILENVYYCYRIGPHTNSKIKSLKKDQKLFLWDWSTINDKGAAFENLVASNLLKYCHYFEDSDGEEMELRYIRDNQKREVDFVVIKNKKPLFAVECKSGEKNLSKHIPYFAKKTSIPIFYQVHKGEAWLKQSDHRAEIIPFTKFCSKILKI